VRILAGIVITALGSGAVNAAGTYGAAVNYQLQCMGCHRADGSGEPGRVPSMRRSLALLSATPEGRDFVIRVPGVAQSALSSEDTAALLNWMMKNLSDLRVPAGVADYSAAEVQRSRVHPLAQVKSLRSRLLRAATARPPTP
jgi:mono/diheme cytochrome c family protein